MNPNLMHEMAQARQADLLREAEEYRRAGLTARPTVLIRISARIPRFPTWSRRRRAYVVLPSAPGRISQASEDPPPKRAIGFGESHDRLIDSVGARELLTRPGTDERLGDAAIAPAACAPSANGVHTTSA